MESARREVGEAGRRPVFGRRKCCPQTRAATSKKLEAANWSDDAATDADEYGYAASARLGVHGRENASKIAARQKLEKVESCKLLKAEMPHPEPGKHGRGRAEKAAKSKR